MTNQRNRIVRRLLIGKPGRNWVSPLMLIGLSVLCYVAGGDLDVAERFMEFSEAHEDWELDELILLPVVWTVGLLFYSIRRWFQLAWEMDKRIAAEQNLARLNGQLERQVDERTKSLQKALQRVSAAQERYELAAQGAEDGLWDWDLAKNEFHYSTPCTQMLGCGEDQPEPGAGLDYWLNRADPADRGIVQSQLERQLEEGGKASFEFRVSDPEQGVYRWIECRSAAAHDSEGLVTRIAGALRDVTEFRAVDVLTGLANRSLFSERLAQALRRCRESSGTNFAVLFIDLDRFKDVNDSLGHLAGDALLVEVSKRLETSLRSGDTVVRAVNEEIVARLGGDEFAVLLEDVGSAEDAAMIGKRLLKQISRPAKVEGRTIRPSASVGIAMGSADYESPDDVLRDADTAMYMSKSKGRSQVELFAPSMRKDLLKSLELENDLATALANREFFVEYQPQISLADESLKGFEALLRWQHPRFGLISPSAFIPIAEKTGAIVEIGNWVLDEVCRQMSKWLREGILDRDLSVSVNVSAKELERTDYPRRVRELVETFDVPASCLSLEITETALIRDDVVTLRTLRELKKIGVQLDIDDFGSGYSTFDYLCRYPFDLLKIDRRFVQSLDEAASVEIVKTLISLSKKLGLQVIAEGVETAEQLKQLQNFGCESAQGFYFSRPLACSKVRAWLDRDLRSDAELELEKSV